MKAMNTLRKKWAQLEPRAWFFFLSFAAIAGVLLRVLHVEDMEYKEDEEYNFVQTQLIGNSQPWPWYGIPSGVYLVNPGMSIWVFTILAKAFHIHTPTDLAHAVQAFALLGMALVIPFALRFVEKTDRPTWFWAFALAMVNPFLVLYQRKLWPEPFLPFFTLLTLMGWYRRERWSWAFLWGLIGAWLGQVHMSGFFFSAALAGWTLVFDPFRRARGPKTHWWAWFAGSTLGALPLIPWALYVLQNPVAHSITTGWVEIVQLKYWVFWLTDPTGLHLGNPLGLLRGQNIWVQISDFVRYPLLNGQATYLIGAAHLAALGAVVFVFAKGLSSLFQRRKNWRELAIGRESNTAFLQNSALLGCGVLLTATGIVIRRYYMTVTFPLEFIFLTRLAGPATRSGRRALILLWIAELFISAGFVNYIHVNQGSTQGDYGEAYHLKHPARGTGDAGHSSHGGS